MNDGLKRIWKESIVAYLRYYPGIHLQGLGNTTKNVRIGGLPAEV
jgi:hypothetical protein